MGLVALLLLLLTGCTLTVDDHIRQDLAQLNAERAARGMSVITLKQYYKPRVPVLDCCHHDNAKPANSRLFRDRYATYAQGGRGYVRHGARWRPDSFLRR